MNRKGQNYKTDTILWNTKQISGFCYTVDKNWALLGYYAENSGNFLLTFWDNLLVPSSRVKNPKSTNSWPLKVGLIAYPKTSVRNS